MSIRPPEDFDLNPVLQTNNVPDPLKIARWLIERAGTPLAADIADSLEGAPWQYCRPERGWRYEAQQVLRRLGLVEKGGPPNQATFVIFTELGDEVRQKLHKLGVSIFLEIKENAPSRRYH